MALNRAVMMQIVWERKQLGNTYVLKGALSKFTYCSC
jgi:hypothetical protein